MYLYSSSGPEPFFFPVYNVFPRFVAKIHDSNSEDYFSKKHLFQLYRSDEFRAYDWGNKTENMRHYNQVRH